MTNGIIKNSPLKVLFIIFFTTLSTSLYPSSFPVKIAEYFARNLGTESLSFEHEQFVRNIIKEMGITKSIHIRKMNRKAVLIYGSRNAFAYLGNYIFIGEAFFKELTPLEQRFLIGHELA